MKKEIKAMLSILLVFVLVFQISFLFAQSDYAGMEATTVYGSGLPLPSFTEGTYYTGSFAGSYQCMGFAKMVYATYSNMTVEQFIPYYNTAYDSSAGYNDVKKKTVGFSDLTEAKNALSGLTKGTYVRFRKKGKTNADSSNGHSVIIMSVNANNIRVYDANYDGNNMVHIQNISYSTIAQKYDQVFIAIQHSYLSSATNYNSTYHYFKCSLSGCVGKKYQTHSYPSTAYKYDATNHYYKCTASGCTRKKYQQHFATTPGPHATCLACGYVGNISIGANAIEDEID